ncbi:MAG: aldehyde ferredoxin oxidoreductase [Anaerolineales bacterium]|uniref:aldehyde ferredoxin oxidoreductase C-terminal domain-containing protein n=1 Tax=Candidatus Villigracilis affinis TaxID=3140682 RepID=UPI001DAB15A5|nr:aldehyde ferredoxin oxidoreductase [Anaerolineales bacterium]MBK9604765.1 aldehyde ferredoxin oxidoreductase [Anaerolineales bacterium]MBL0345747.1 aldehyde ferredoxin oxidoreductase [Anaerolineales bacterium]
MAEYKSQIWRVNTRTQELKREPVPENWQRLGGRGLIARVLVDEVDAKCDPLGAENKLIFTPGLLVGHMLSSTDRLSVGGKSPLTGGIKEANAGGRTGYHMAFMGMHALIIEDMPNEDGYWVLYLSMNGAKWERADDLAGLGVYATAPKLLEKYGDKVAISMIGPGGEMRMKSAGIQNLDKDRIPSRIAARGGLGAVMGSKGLKAIVFDHAGGQKPAIADPEAFKVAQKDYTQSVMNHPQSVTYRDYGTAAMAQMTQSFAAIPAHNFSRGTFDNVEAISGETLREFTLTRGKPSDPAHACMAGCTIKCSNVFGGEDGKIIVSPLEYETIGLMGTNLDIDSLDAIGRMNWHVNDLGLDSIEVGGALGVAAEAGLMRWGSEEDAQKLIDEMRAGTELGRILGDGAVTVGKKYNIERVPAVKGQAMSAYEPRSIKGTGVTYATTPQGADHTCGLTIRAKVNHLDPTQQKEASLNAQLNMAGYDTLGACIFAGFGYAATPDGVVKRLLKARYGWDDLPDNILQALGKETIKLEREFNKRAGFTKEDDRLPKWMMEEAIPENGSVFDVSEDVLDHIFDGIE